MAPIYFKHQSAPLFRKRNQKRKVFYFFYRAVMAVLILSGLILVAFIFIQSDYFKNLSKLSSAEEKENTFSFKKEPEAQVQPIYSVILPHHDLVKKERAVIWQELSNLKNIESVILVSPNHFNSGDRDIITTDKVWQLQNERQINPAKNLTNLLSEKGLAFNSQSVFHNEHGISNLLEELKDSLPEADILPLIIKAGTPKEKLDSLGNQLSSSCQNKCLLIASVDFSHYQPQALASLHDLASVRALAKLDLESILNDIEVDSPESLYLAALFAKNQQTDQLVIKNQTNSGAIEQQRDSETTTHLFAYFSQNEADQPKREEVTTFLLAGDIMLDRLINHRFKDDQLVKVFTNFGDRVFWGVDIALANLEGPISAEPIDDNISPDNLIFNFPPKTPEILNYLHLDTVSLANNHSLNAGALGFVTTKMLLTQKGISAFGHQKEFGDFSVFRSDQGDIPVSIIGLNLLEGSHQLALKEKIANEKKAGRFVIIFPHWGEEYSLTHSERQETLAADWVSAGADLIIGSHPHVVQDVARINKTPIFYSLGNFVFDQTFSKDTQKGLLIAGKISQESIELIPLPIQSVNLQPKMIQGDEKTKIIDDLVAGLNLSGEDSYDAKKGTIILKR